MEVNVDIENVDKKLTKWRAERKVATDSFAQK